MRAMTTTALRRTLAETIDSVIRDKDQVAITRGKGAVVILDSDEWAELVRLADQAQT